MDSKDEESSNKKKKRGKGNRRPFKNGNKPFKNGDNPNKANAKGSKLRLDIDKSIPKTKSNNTIEMVEPRKYALDMNAEGISITKHPGHREVGKIELREEMIQELITWVTTIIYAALSQINLKMINFPGPYGSLQANVECYARVIVHVATTIQLYSTLKNTNQNGMAYKIKAMESIRLSIPTFLLPIISSIGSVKVKEGIIGVKSIERLVLQYAARSARQMEICCLPLGRKEYDDVDIKDSLFDNSLSRDEEFSQYCRVVGIKDKFKIGKTDFEIQPDKMTISFIDEMTKIKKIADDRGKFYKHFIKYRNHKMTHKEFCAEIKVSNGNQKFSDTEIVKHINDYAPKFQLLYNGWIEQKFETSEYTGTGSGTTAQFVTPCNRLAQFPYSISDNEAIMGLILIPAKSVVYRPRYTVFSEKTREEMVYQLSEKFVSK